MPEFCKFPEGMAHLILSRLPPKSLMRFKSIRKSWNSLIENPSFVAEHLSICMHNKYSTSILCKRFAPGNTNSDETKIVITLISLDNDNDDAEHVAHSVIEDIDLPLSMDEITMNEFNEPRLLGALCIMGHCHGIFCLVYGDIVLWNPAIRQYKVLPDSCHPNGIIDSIGFGYDAKSNDYKVFSLPAGDEDDPTGDGRYFFYPPRVEVYSLLTDSWTEITTGHLETETTIFIPEAFQIYCKGICYWTGREQQKDYMSVHDIDDADWVRQLIVLYDLSCEVFDHKLFPYSLYEPLIPHLEMHVISWKESIALFGQYCVAGSIDTYGLWVMDDIVKGSWTKQLTLEDMVGTRCNLALWKWDEILKVANDTRICSYSFSSQVTNFLPIKSLHPEFSEAVVCVSSIVSVIQGKQQP